MTREEFFYQCIDVIEHWLNGNRKLSDLREVTDKLYNEVTKPHWISVEDELPKENDFILIYGKDGVGVWLYESPNAEEKIIANHITHWMPLPQPPVLSNSENTGKDEKGE